MIDGDLQTDIKHAEGLKGRTLDMDHQGMVTQ